MNPTPTPPAAVRPRLGFHRAWAYPRPWNYPPVLGVTATPPTVPATTTNGDKEPPATAPNTER